MGVAVLQSELEKGLGDTGGVYRNGECCKGVGGLHILRHPIRRESQLSTRGSQQLASSRICPVNVRRIKKGRFMIDGVVGVSFIGGAKCEGRPVCGSDALLLGWQREVCGRVFGAVDVCDVCERAKVSCEMSLMEGGIALHQQRRLLSPTTQTLPHPLPVQSAYIPVVMNSPQKVNKSVSFCGLGIGRSADPKAEEIALASGNDVEF